MKKRVKFLLGSLFAGLSLSLCAQTSPYIDTVFEYSPAPGQFINELTWGSPTAAQSVVGGVSGHVSLGAYGGYIIVGFDHTIANNPESSSTTYGVDFTVVGNAFTDWSEPGIVMVMQDVNENGLPDDNAWYELKGCEYDNSGTVQQDYDITYTNPDGIYDVPWEDNQNDADYVYVNSWHNHEYYPDADSFPHINQDSIYLEGLTMIIGEIDKSNSSYITSAQLDSGYADNRPLLSGDPVTAPDNPTTTSTVEGAGGDPMKLEWAIDTNGNSVTLTGIDFVKIYTGINDECGWLGEQSTELKGIVDVAESSESSSSSSASSSSLKVYPTEAAEELTIAVESENDIVSTKIVSIGGRVLYSSSEPISVNEIDLSYFDEGVYLVIVTTETEVLKQMFIKK